MDIKSKTWNILNTEQFKLITFKVKHQHTNASHFTKEKRTQDSTIKTEKNQQIVTLF